MTIIEVVTAKPVLEAMITDYKPPIVFSRKITPVIERCNEIVEEFEAARVDFLQTYGAQAENGKWTVDPDKVSEFEDAIREYLNQETVMPDVKFRAEYLDTFLSMDFQSVQKISWLLEDD